MKFVPQRLGSITSIDTSETWTRPKLSAEIELRSSSLVQQGVERGDRVLILHANTPLFFADLFATWDVGACAVVLNPNLTKSELERICDLVHPRVKLYEENQLRSEEVRICKTRLFASSTNAHMDDYALILFTSGTTGSPKGVVHTFRSILSRVALNIAKIPKNDLKVTLSPLPTYFGHGLIGNCLTPLFANQDLMLISDAGLKVATCLGEIIDENGITFLSSVPSMWKGVVKYARPPKQGTLRRVHIGSAPLSSELWKEVIDWSGTNCVANMYGLTETANWIAGALATEMCPVDGLVGEMWGGQAAIITDQGDLASVGSGEVVVQTPSLMSGYYNNEELNVDTISGWFRTGDIGSIDKSGVIRLTGRKKLQINRGGMKVSPEDVELLLERHRSVKEACAFPVPDDISGELVGVAVVPTDGHVIELDDLRIWCQKYLAVDKIPEKWFSVKEIRKTERGKIDRSSVIRDCLDKGKRK